MVRKYTFYSNNYVTKQINSWHDNQRVLRLE